MATLYYIHTGLRSENLARYRITGRQAVKILQGVAAADILAEIMSPDAEAYLTPAAQWSLTHKYDARSVYPLLQADQRLNVGLCINARVPWLAHDSDEFTWSEDNSPGEVYYHAPYSKLLPQQVSNARLTELAFGAAVLEWSRPYLTEVVWTPGISACKFYQPDSVIVESGLVESGLGTGQPITLQQLWQEAIYPACQRFYEQHLQPALLAAGLEPDVLYRVNPYHIAVTADNALSSAALLQLYKA